jgi:mono/diheme cytochrome c family protein
MKATIKNCMILMGLVLAGGTVIAEKSACAVVSVTASVPTGAALYAQNCENCHGALTSSTKIGADSNRIQNAISSNAGGMGFLTILAATDIQAITAVLTAP